VFIRRATRIDSPGVAPLLTQLGYPATPDQVDARFARAAESEVDAAWVAVTQSNGQETIVAFAAGHLSWPYELDHAVAELTALVVDETHRGEGYGRALVAAFEDWVASAGGVRASAATALHREGAHSFYERLGYRQLAKKYEKSM